MQEDELQTSVLYHISCFLFAEYLALAGLMNLLAQLSDRIHHFMDYNNLMPWPFQPSFLTFALSSKMVYPI